MGSIALILVLVFVLLLVMNVPIAVAIALSSFVAILAEGSDPSIVMAAKMANGVIAPGMSRILRQVSTRSSSG